jgi:TonB family protein
MNIRRTIHHGGGGLRWAYNRHLAQGLAISLLLHLLAIGGYLLFGAPDPVQAGPVSLTPLSPPQYDTTVTMVLPLKKIDRISGGGGGSPDVDKPLGPAKRGLPEAAPKLADVSKPGRSVSKTPTHITVVRKDPKEVAVATTRNRDSTNDRSPNLGETGQNPDGKGTKVAGGSGGPGIGTGHGGGVGVGDGGIGGRGWVRHPRSSARYPDGASGAGRVVLSFTVMPNGTITNIRPVSSPDPALQKAAIAALRNARAKPLPEDVPQEAHTHTIPFNFTH